MVMEYLVIILICVITIVVLKIGFNVKTKDIKRIKEIGTDEKLNGIANKFPANRQICEKILEKLGNKNVTIEENEETKTSLFLVVTNKIIIAKIKDSFTRIQTIAHECLHSVQSRRILLFNFIFSNIFLLSFIVFLVLIFFKVGNAMNYIVAYTMLALIYLCIKEYIETEAMGKAKYLAKEYMQEYSAENKNVTKQDIEVLVDNFENLNKIGIPLTNFWLAAITILKIIILAVIAFIVDF